MSFKEVLKKRTSQELLVIIHEATKVLGKRTIKERYEEYGELSLHVDGEVVASGSYEDLIIQSREYPGYEWFIATKVGGEIIADNEGYEMNEKTGYGAGELERREKLEKEAKQKELIQKYNPRQLTQMIIDRVKASPQFENIDDRSSASDLVYDIIEQSGLDDIVAELNIFVADIVDELDIKEKNWFEKTPNMLKRAVRYLADDISGSWPDKDPSDCVMSVMRRFRFTPDNQNWDSLCETLLQAFENEHGMDIHDFFDQISDDVDHDDRYEPPTIGRTRTQGDQYKKMILPALEKFGISDCDIQISGNGDLLLSNFQPLQSDEVLAKMPKAIKKFLPSVEECLWDIVHQGSERLVVKLK